jgi:hypothetical protein
MNQNHWFGSTTRHMTQHDHDETKKSALSKALATAEAYRAAVSKKEYERQLSTDEVAVHQLRDHIAETLLLYNDYKSPEEEATNLLRSVKEFLTSDVEAQFFRAKGISDDLVISARRTAKMRAIEKFLNVNPNGDPMPLSLHQYFTFGSPFKKLVWKIVQARSKAGVIVDHLYELDDDDYDEEHKDVALMQHFVMEQVCESL